LAARLASGTGTPALPASVLHLAGRRGDSRLVTTAAQLARAGDTSGPELSEAAAQALAAHVGRAEAGELIRPA
jgi:hypothetical protein